MPQIKLKDRIESYQSQSDYKLLSKIPIIIIVNGRSFYKTTSLLDKPYCDKFAECISSTMLKLCAEVEGAIFGYSHKDEIVIVARNDQNIETSSWYDNKVQKISSITSSIASLHFNKCASAIELNIIGDALFTSQVFVVPNIAEAINTMVFKQQQNLYDSVQLSCFYELINKKYDKSSIKEMLSGLSIDDKISLLNQECNIDYNQYPITFRRGIACYRVPKLIDQSLKNKWFINEKIPIFTRDQTFLSNIFKMGHDVFRGDLSE